MSNDVDVTSKVLTALLSDPAEARAFLATPSAFEETQVLVDKVAARIGVFLVPPVAAGLFAFAHSQNPDDPLLNLAFVGTMAIAAAAFCGWRVFKAGYLVLDPERGEVLYSGQRIPFDKILAPKVSSLEVEFTSTQWHPMRGSASGLEITRGRRILFNAGHSDRDLERLAELLAAMVSEYREKEKVRTWLRESEARKNDRRQRSQPDGPAPLKPAAPPSPDPETPSADPLESPTTSSTEPPAPPPSPRTPSSAP